MDRAPDAAASGPAGASGAHRTAAAAAASPGNHAVYAQNGLTCAECHPCGQRIAGGHGADWMDQASAGFHAVAANAGLAACQTCHGAALDGVGGTTTVSCARCHGATWRTSCTKCHGGTDSTTGAPPRATWANGADAVRVGAHTAHLGATHGLAAPVACGACHTVPADALSAGHVDGGTAEVTFGGLAVSGGASPTWARPTATCSNVYCHGGTLGAGGTATAPTWTAAAGTQVTCGSCHGAPPPSPHPAGDACGTCHAGYSATTVNATTHIDGKVDVVAMTCTSCHGDATRAATTLNPQLAAAPPVGTHGETAATARAVGAHQAHLNAGAYANAFACTECHAVPTSTSHATGTVDLTWGTLARTGGATPSWNGTTCTNYCHGSTLAAGGTDTAPTWTGGAAEAACGTCHGAPPPSPHSASTACGSCHTGYTATSVNLATHLNGTVDVVAMTCTSCHGDATRAATTLNPQLPAAPPVGTRGETATTARAVGAHQAHLAGTTISNGVACTECHTVPTSTSHANGTALVTFGTLARTSSSAATWNTATLTCSATWCHGARLTGGTNTAPSWTRVDGTQDACGTCHGRPPTSGRHTSVSRHRSASCGTCHGGTYSSTVADRALHFNGRFDMSTATNIGWVASSRTCTASLTGCHGGKRETW